MIITIEGADARALEEAAEFGRQEMMKRDQCRAAIEDAKRQQRKKRP